MKITVTTTSQTFKEIVGDTVWEKLKTLRDSKDFTITLQNLGVNDVYLEVGEAATVADGFKLAASGGEKELKYQYLENLNLIADTLAVTDFRFIIT